MSTIYLVLISLLAFFLFLYKYFTRSFSFWSKINIPYAKPTFIVGNLGDLILQRCTLAECFKKIYDEHSDKRYVGIFGFHKPVLLVRDPELIRLIMAKDFHVFHNHIITFCEETDPLLAYSVVTIKIEKWRYLKPKLTSTFTSGKMKRMFFLVDQCAKELISLLDRNTRNSCDVMMKDAMTRFTTDTIACCAFGIDCNSLKNTEVDFKHVLEKLLQINIKRLLALLLSYFSPRMKKLLHLQVMDNWMIDFYRKCVWSTAEHREKNGITRGDFLDNLISLRNKSKEQDLDKAQAEDESAPVKIDGDVLVAQAFTFIFGGYETSSGTLTFSLYELALNPDVQNRLREEITEVLAKHNNEATYEGMNEMTYLDMVVSETLRKYPIGPLADREASIDYELPAARPNGGGKVTLPAGTAVIIPIYAVHHDPKYYPEPDKFDPERFTEENKRKRPHYTYLPFGEGPRICIGMRFALMQIKTALIHILSNYEVTPSKDTPVPLVKDPKQIFVSIKGDIHLTFKKLPTVN